jgi:hypothetical protein
MASMADSARRAALLERSKALRAKATAFSDRLKDARARWETMWLDSAEMMLTAEQSFSKFESQVSSYGGPENIKMVG